jgi:hypothetical protein
MLQFFELALNTGQTFFDSGSFHLEKIGFVRGVAKDGCQSNGENDRDGFPFACDDFRFGQFRVCTVEIGI